MAALAQNTHAANRYAAPPAPQPQQQPQAPQPLPLPEVVIDERRDDQGAIIQRRWRTGRLLGKGGFAKCYKFTREGTNKVLAGKVVDKDSLNKNKAKQKLLAEIKIHRSLKHPFIVGFETFFEDKANVYILLELCSNQTLMEFVKRRKQLTEPEAAYFALQILDAMRYLHHNNIIHRDLKLGNLFVTGDMQIRVGDFGLATQLATRQERKKTVCGTPNYIAPEILDGSRTDGHSFEVDTWAFGVILYTMIIGKPPFETSDVKATYKRIKENDYGFPDGVPISNDARDLIQRILQPNPAMRPTLDQIACHPFFTSPRMYVPLSLPVTALQGPPQLLFHDVVPGRTQVDHMLRQPLGGLIMRSRSLQPASQNENAAPGNYDQPQMLPVPPLARTHSAPADVYRPGPQQQQQQQQQYYQNHHYGGAGSSASSAASGAYDKENDGMSTGTGMGPRGKASASIASSSATGAGVESVAPGDMAQLMHMDSAGQYTNGGESVSMSGLDTPMSQTNGGAGGNWLNGLQSAPSSRAPSVLGNATSSAYNGENIYLRNGKVVGSSAVAGAASNDHGTGASAPKRAALGAIGQSGPVAGAALSSGRSASAAAGAGGGFGYTGAAAAASHGTRQATATAGGMHVAGSTAPINAHRPISAAVAPPTLPSSAAASSSTGNGSYKPFAAFQDTVGAGGAQRQALGSAGSTDGFGRQQVQQTYNLRSNSTANQMDVDSSGAPAPQQQHHQQQQSAFRSVAQAASVPLPSSAAATPAPSSGSLNDTMRNIFENLQIASVASTAPANPFSSTVQQRGGYASAVSAVGRRTSTPGGHMVMSPAAGQGHAAAAGGSPGAEAPIQPPTVWITQFLDYTSKYGFGYLMSNGAVGVYFNDATKILISSDGNNFEYIERQSAAGNAVIPGATYITGVDGQPRIVGSVLSYPEAMKKKVTLVKYFRTYLLEQYQRRRLLGEGRITQEEVAATSSGLFAGAATSGDANQATYVPLPTCREEEILMSQGTAGWSDGSVPFVKKWSRTRRSSIMRLSNQTMQISFYDGTSLIIQPDGSSASYINITGEILHLNVISVLIAAGSSGGWNGGSSGSSMISNGTAMSTGSRVALGGMGSPSAMMVDGTPTPALSLDVTVNIAKKINYTRALLQQLLYPQTQGPAAPAAR